MRGRSLTGEPENNDANVSYLLLMTPDADGLVGRWRAEHDWAARFGIGAHVTVRTPFLHREEWADRRITDVLKPFLPLTINLARLENRPGALVILVEPDDELRVMTAAIDAGWPTLPAHRGRNDFAYHVTVVRTPDPLVREAASAEIAPQLPLPAIGSELWAAHVDRDRHMSHAVIARGHTSDPHA